MAINEHLTGRIRDVLEGRNDVEEKRMFRGVCFMVKGKMCVTVGDDEIMCRIDPATQEELIQKKGCRVMEMKGKPLKGYVLVQEDALKTDEQLQYWIDQALAFNSKAKAAPKRKKNS